MNAVCQNQNMPYKTSMKRKRGPENLFGVKRSKATAYKKRSLTSKVNRLIANQEVKNFDVGGTITTVAGTATITPLTNITVGDTANTRDGRKVMLTAVSGRYYLTTTGNTYWRVLVVYDAQPNGVTATAAEILESAGDPLSPMSLTWGKRFTVVHDNQTGYGQDTAGVLGTSGAASVCKWYKKLDNICEFGAATPPAIGALVMLTIGTAVISQNHYTRVRFIDA